MRFALCYLKQEEGINMKRFLSYFVLLTVISLPCYAIGQEKEVIVHEAWFVHMESAGGWVAVDKGFYGKVKVKEVQGGPGISPIQKVVAAVRAGNIAFGNDYPENIIRAREKEGIDLVAVSVDFQTSAMRIISWKPIKSAKGHQGRLRHLDWIRCQGKMCRGKRLGKTVHHSKPGRGYQTLAGWDLATGLCDDL